MKRVLAGMAAVLIMVSAPAWAETNIKAHNSSDNVETNTGDATANNDAAGVVGHSTNEQIDVVGADIANASATNVQDGDNEMNVDQDATAHSGTAVSGQVVAGRADGDLTIDAANITMESSAESGDATADNDAAGAVGLLFATETLVAADIANGNAVNVQDGDNAGDIAQDTDALSGNAITGQLVGAQTFDGGSADLTVSNTSDDSDSTSGDSEQNSDSALIVGLDVSGAIDI